MDILGTVSKLATESGFSAFFTDGGWKNLVMIILAFMTVPRWILICSRIWAAGARGLCSATMAPIRQAA